MHGGVLMRRRFLFRITMRTLFSLLVVALALIAIAPGPAHASDPIAALYETHYTDPAGKTIERGRWYLLRQNQRIETLSDDRAEIWEREASGRISLRRVFRDHQMTIEYSAAELAVRGIALDWDALGSVIPTTALNQLKPVEKAGDKAASEKFTLSGTANGEEVEVHWLPQAGIPAFVKRSGPNGTFEMRLSEKFPSAPKDWLPSSRWPVRDFRVIDVADLGDLEHDASVKRLLRDDRGGRFLDPHAHAH